MERAINKTMQDLDENQLKNHDGGSDNICAALAGATLTSAVLLNGAGFLFFGAGYLIFCVEGHG